MRELTDAYVFLRNLEHRLQYLDDQQTQVLPRATRISALIAAAHGLRRLSRSCAPSSSSIASRVTRHFESIFADVAAADAHPLAALWHGADDGRSRMAMLRELGLCRPAARAGAHRRAARQQPRAPDAAGEPGAPASGWCRA